MAELKADHRQSIRLRRKGLFRFAWAGSLAIFSIVMLTVYYGYAADERLPSFHLETIEGDASIGAAIQLDGSYVGRWGNRGMKVDVEGTTYTDSNRVGRLFILPFSKTYNASTEALIKAHRGFMRGKEYGWFDQTDDMLVYVEVVPKHGEVLVKLSVLNKKTDKSADFTWLAGAWKQRENVGLADLQIQGGKVHLLLQRTDVTRSNMQSDPLLFDYVFDVTAGKLIDTREIKLPVQSGYNLSVAGNQWARSDTKNAVLFASRQAKAGKAAGGDHSASSASEEPPIIEYEPFVYNYAEGSLQPLDLVIPNNMAHANYYVNGDKLYSVTVSGDSKGWNGKSFGVVETDLSKQEQTAAYTILASDLGGKELYQPRFSNGKLYFVVPGAQENGAMGRTSTKVAVVDAGTGKTIYQGQVAYDGPSSKSTAELKQTVLLNLELRT
ncbi:hypothetical protein [Cohnella sp. GCM10012308]|uniref:hypothetical protein n=1 Tax=Cohnella sp. GCM10012308 TaxID=3317329 RepID=UPI003618694B